MRLRQGTVSSPRDSESPPSTVHILTSTRSNRLSHGDRATGEPIRRYEPPNPGSLIHVDVKKVEDLPDGGGLALGRTATGLRRTAPRRRANRRTSGTTRRMGYAFVHTVIDDRSRVVHAESTTTRPRHDASLSPIGRRPVANAGMPFPERTSSLMRPTLRDDVRRDWRAFDAVGPAC